MKAISLVLAAVLFLLSGCAGQGAEPTGASVESASAVSFPTEDSEADTITFADDLGRTVELARPKRVAALIGSFADIWCLAGGQDSLVAAAGDAWTSFDLGLDESVADLGAVKEPSLEVLLAAEPDFVLGSISTVADLELENALEQAGITVAYFDVDGFDDYLRMLEICTLLTGCEGNYTLYGTDVIAQVDEAIARQDGSAPTVLYVRATGSSCKAKGSEGNVLGEMLVALGCVNIADDDNALLDSLSLEAIIAADPDYIFAVCQGADPTQAQAMLEETLLQNPAWNNLRAVQEGRFHTMEHELYNLKPNARWGEAYEKLADILYSEQSQ